MMYKFTFIITIIMTVMGMLPAYSQIGYVSGEKIRNYPQKKNVTTGKKNAFKILGETRFKRTKFESIFPKSKTSNSINPRFKKSNFQTRQIFKQNKIIKSQLRAMRKGGINNSFRTLPKKTDEKNIPPELLKLLKK